MPQAPLDEARVEVTATNVRLCNWSFGSPGVEAAEALRLYDLIGRALPQIHAARLDRLQRLEADRARDLERVREQIAQARRQMGADHAPVPAGLADQDEAE